MLLLRALAVLLVLPVLLVLTVLLPAAPAAAAPAWGWPLDGRPAVSRPFAPGPTPYSPGHRGVDLTARRGAAVLSAGAGVVAYAGPLAGRGVVVVVHGVLRTTYEPVEAGVRVGQPVLRGQRIGSLQGGHRGCPAAACLHWGLRRGLDHLDPLRLVGAARVRLLPRGVSGDGAQAGGAGSGAVHVGVVRPAGPSAAAVPAGPPAGAPPPAAVAPPAVGAGAPRGAPDPPGPAAGVAVVAGLLAAGALAGRRAGPRVRGGARPGPR